jgi:FkbM family methyltransferase
MKSMLLIPFGRKGMQWFFERLRKASLVGLNIGRGGRVEESGEEFVLQYVKQRLGSKPVCIFDVGANVGDWSAKALEIFDLDRVQVFAFEPARFPFEHLGGRFQKYPQFRRLNFGLGDQEGAISLFSNEPSSGIASLYQRRLDHFGVELKEKETVMIRTLNSFCRENQIEAIDFLKLDVEGHELRVLEGARQLLEANKIRMIQFEFGGCNIDSRTYFQDFFYLLNSRYRLFRVLKNGLMPIPEYREIDECFVTTNYFAELRS